MRPIRAAYSNGRCQARGHFWSRSLPEPLRRVPEAGRFLAAPSGTKASDGAVVSHVPLAERRSVREREHMQKQKQRGILVEAARNRSRVAEVGCSMLQALLQSWAQSRHGEYTHHPAPICIPQSRFETPSSATRPAATCSTCSLCKPKLPQLAVSNGQHQLAVRRC